MFSDKMAFENGHSFEGISGISPNNDSAVFNEESKQEIFYTIKINAPQGQYSPLPPQTSTPEQPEREPRSGTNKNPFTLETSGYEINRELYSDEEIRDAFKAIDIDRDGALTFDDISFFLKCMGQEHASQEVQEMIRIISTDGKKVLLDDFRKIGKGRIAPFAGIKVPNHTIEKKQTILSNIKNSDLFLLEPEELVRAEANLFVTYDKYQQEKALKRNEGEIEIEIEVDEDQNLLKSRTNSEIAKKKELSSSISMLNVEKVVEILKNSQKQYLQSKDIAQLITINESNAKLLFVQSSLKRVRTRQIILDAILFSNKHPIEQMQLILLNVNKSQSLGFNEWLQVVVYMIGSDQKELAKKRLTHVLKHRKLSIHSDFDKYFILKIMTEEMSLFRW